MSSLIIVTPQNSHTNSQTLFAQTKMWLFEYRKDFGKINSLYFFNFLCNAGLNLRLFWKFWQKSISKSSITQKVTHYPNSHINPNGRTFLASRRCEYYDQFASSLGLRLIGAKPSEPRKPVKLASSLSTCGATVYNTIRGLTFKGLNYSLT